MLWQCSFFALVRVRHTTNLASVWKTCFDLKQINTCHLEHGWRRQSDLFVGSKKSENRPEVACPKSIQRSKYLKADSLCGRWLDNRLTKLQLHQQQCKHHLCIRVLWQIVGLCKSHTYNLFLVIFRNPGWSSSTMAFGDLTLLRFHHVIVFLLLFQSHRGNLSEQHNFMCTDSQRTPF